MYVMYNVYFFYLFFLIYSLWWVVDFQCFIIFLYQPRLVEGLLRVVRICYALIAPCSVKTVLVAFLSFLFSLFPPYFITAGGLPCRDGRVI
jgi:hypothetical protein